jgi:hypothetical protein
MNINKLKWGKCPKCKILINGWRFYPASLVKENSGNGFWIELECPSCKAKLLAAMTVEATIELEEAQ